MMTIKMVTLFQGRGEQRQGDDSQSQGRCHGKKGQAGDEESIFGLGPNVTRDPGARFMPSGFPILQVRLLQ